MALTHHKAKMLDRIQSAALLEKHVSVFQGLAEIGDATGVYAEAERLRKEVEKHNAYATTRLQETNPAPETSEGLRRREENKAQLEEMLMTTNEFQRQLTYFQTCEKQDLHMVKILIETNAEDKIHTVMAEYAE